MSIKGDTNKLQLEECDGSKGQTWKYKKSEHIKTKSGDKCVSIKGDVEDGGKVRLEKCDGSNKQKWELSPKGWFKSKVDSKLCIDVEGNNNVASGASLQLGNCNTWTIFSDQRWNLVEE